MLHDKHFEPAVILAPLLTQFRSQGPAHTPTLAPICRSPTLAAQVCGHGVTHLLPTASHVTGQPSQADPRAGSEQQRSQQMERGPCQHTGHQCGDLRVTCTAQQAICSRFGSDGAFQGVILVLANGNNHAWLSQVHGSLRRIG